MSLSPTTAYGLFHMLQFKVVSHAFCINVTGLVVVHTQPKQYLTHIHRKISKICTNINLSNTYWIRSNQFVYSSAFSHNQILILILSIFCNILKFINGNIYMTLCFIVIYWIKFCKFAYNPINMQPTGVICP